MLEVSWCQGSARRMSYQELLSCRGNNNRSTNQTDELSVFQSVQYVYCLPSRPPSVPTGTDTINKQQTLPTNFT